MKLLLGIPDKSSIDALCIRFRVSTFSGRKMIIRSNEVGDNYTMGVDRNNQRAKQTALLG